MLSAAGGIAMLCLSLAVLGCATTRPAPSPPARPLRATASEDIQVTALRPWLDCAGRQISQMDDGKSDYQMLAVKIADSCRVQYRAYFNVSTQGMTDADRLEARRRLENWDVDQIALMILARRKAAGGGASL